MHFGPEDDAGVSSLYPKQPASNPAVSQDVEVTISKLKRRLMECVRSPASSDAREQFEAELRTALQASAEAVEPVAFVPVHPRNGALWMDTFKAGEDVTERRSNSYPTMALYTAPPLPAQVQAAEPVMHLRQYGDVTSAQMDEYLQTGTIAGRCADPMDTPLPCDVVVGHVTMRKGVKLATLVQRMQTLYEMASRTPAPGMAGGVVPDETQALKRIISECLDALGNGAGSDPTNASVQYLRHAPAEIRAHIAKLKVAAPHPAPAQQAAGAVTVTDEELAAATKAYNVYDEGEQPMAMRAALTTLLCSRRATGRAGS